jgi:hypothetical protein
MQEEQGRSDRSVKRIGSGACRAWGSVQLEAAPGRISEGDNERAGGRPEDERMRQEAVTGRRGSDGRAATVHDYCGRLRPIATT